MYLILRNIKKNKLDYLLYSVAITIATTILYIFNSIVFGGQVENLINEYNKVNGIFYSAIIVIMLIIVGFIWYTNRFLMKKRSKEIGIFFLLGMNSSKVANMFFGELLLVGTMAIAAGNILAEIFLNIFGLLNSMVIKETFHFAFNLKVLSITDILFGFFYIIICLNTSGFVTKIKLIDLFNSKKTPETISRNFLYRKIPAILLIIIGYATYPWAIATLGLSIVVTLLLVIRGTYKFFEINVSTKLLAKKESVKLTNWVDLLATSNLLFKVKNNTKNFSSFSILIATSLTALGVSLGFYFSSDGGASTEILSSILLIGISIGLIFTICSITIMTFKYVEEAYDDREKYTTLKKIGLSEGNLKLVISKQLFLSYIYPLKIGVIHSLVALSILILGLRGKFFIVIGGLYLIYFMIYFISFLITRAIYIKTVFN